ncbi:hypothetical protein [Salinispora vitiensis]|uniref:hypothetical protein n=1 Tax=Salinispora vitiensis TaxID=999544 RepID=UPI000382142B|nr:hypothetical protein [Salinispora vitiensis]
MQQTGHFKGEGGVIWEMALPLPETQADKVTKGYLRRVNADGSPYTPPPADGQPESSGQRPAVLPGGEWESLPDRGALKAEWVGWVVRNLGTAPDDVEAMTKHDLIDLATRTVTARAPAD